MSNNNRPDWAQDPMFDGWRRGVDEYHPHLSVITRDTGSGAMLWIYEDGLLLAFSDKGTDGYPFPTAEEACKFAETVAAELGGWAEEDDV